MENIKPSSILYPMGFLKKKLNMKSSMILCWYFPLFNTLNQAIWGKIKI